MTGALSAVAVGRIFGMDDREIARALAEFEPPPMRCQITRVAGATIIDDTYNASPVAMRAALELLRDFDAPGRRIVVCGDMRELGDASEKLHRALGDQVVTLCGADLLVACGDYAEHVVAGARAAGMPQARSLACRELDEFLARATFRCVPATSCWLKARERWRWSGSCGACKSHRLARFDTTRSGYKTTKHLWVPSSV